MYQHLRYRSARWRKERNGSQIYLRKLWLKTTQTWRGKQVSKYKKYNWSHSVMSDSLWPPRTGSPPGSSIHGIFQARVLEWVAISFSRGSSQPRDRTQVSRNIGRCFAIWATRVYKVANKMNLNRSKIRDTIIKMAKVKEKTLETARGKKKKSKTKTVILKQIPIRPSTDFFAKKNCRTDWSYTMYSKYTKRGKAFYKVL